MVYRSNPDDEEKTVTDLDDMAARIASYAPAVVAGDPDAAAQLWARQGSYAVDGWLMQGRAQVHAMVKSPAHRNLVLRRRPFRAAAGRRSVADQRPDAHEILTRGPTG